MWKKHVQRKEIEMIKTAWKNNTGGIKAIYQKILDGFLKSCF